MRKGEVGAKNAAFSGLCCWMICDGGRQMVRSVPSWQTATEIGRTKRGHGPGTQNGDGCYQSRPVIVAVDRDLPSGSNFR